MEQPLLSCIESKVENNRSFYGRFQLGPFNLGQGDTIANALRRSLLSELSGLAITAVEIEGVTHEYSTLLGVRETVLDLLLNFKQIILTSDKEQQKSQIGFLQVQGPGIVRASDLKLPSSIQCVDPDQYLATLSYDTLLNVRFTISQGKNYIIQTPSGLKTLPSQLSSHFSNQPGWDNMVKNKNFLKSSETRNSCYFKKSEIVKNQEFLKSGDNKLKKLASFKKLSFLTTKQIYKPLKKIKNSVLDEALPSQIFLSKVKTNETFPSISQVKYNNTLFQKSKGKISPFLLNSFFIQKNQQLFENSQNKFQQLNLPLKNKVKNNKKFDQVNESCLNYKLKNKKQKIASNILPIDAVFMPVNKVNFLLEVDNDSLQPRNRIILEIWTNGSIHPRQALYNAAESMVQLFSFFVEKKKTPLFSDISNTDSQNLDFDIVSSKKKHTIDRNNNDLVFKSEILTADPSLVGGGLPTPSKSKSGNQTPSKTDFSAINGVTPSRLKKARIVYKPAFQSVQPLFSNHLIKLLSKNATNRLLASFLLKQPLTKSLNQVDLFNTSSRFNVYTKSKNKFSFIEKKNLNLTSKLSGEKNKTSLDIGNLDLSLRPYTCLKRANIDTVADLLKFSRDELLLLKNFGKRSLDEVESNLQKIGLRLRN